MELLNLAAAAKYLAMSESGLRKLIKRRAIRYSQSGRWGRIRFRQEWLDEFVASGEVAPISDDTPNRNKPSERPKHTGYPKTGSRHGLDYRLLDL